MKYRIAPDVRIYIHNNLINIRKGVWNIINGEIDTDTISPQDQEKFKNIVFELKKGNNIDLPNDLFVNKSTNTIIEQLICSQFIENIDSTLDLPENDFECLLITDNTLPQNTLQELMNCSNIKVQLPSEEQKKFLFQIHDLNRTNYIEYDKKIQQAQDIIGTIPILVIQTNINISLLRLLNRSLLNNVPMFIGFIDGPFIIYTSIQKNISPCFECFEQTMLAKLEDHVLYENFNKELFLPCNKNNPQILTGLSFIIYNMFQDVLSFYSNGKADFCTRVLQIYSPSLEIQYQDIIKIPSCPQCGYLSDTYLMNSTMPIDQLLENI